MSVLYVTNVSFLSFRPNGAMDKSKEMGKKEDGYEGDGNVVKVT